VAHAPHEEGEETDSAQARVHELVVDVGSEEHADQLGDVLLLGRLRELFRPGLETEREIRGDGDRDALDVDGLPLQVLALERGP
jgi:hypothetical protein